MCIAPYPVIPTHYLLTSMHVLCTYEQVRNWLCLQTKKFKIRLLLEEQFDQRLFYLLSSANYLMITRNGLVQIIKTRKFCYHD